jgi:hypothetical protein
VGASRREHITPLLESLHWLPIEQRIRFKILLLVFKSVNNSGPENLCDLITHYVPSRSLRSESQNLLDVPLSRSALVNNSVFNVAGPKLLISLPLFIKKTVIMWLISRRL